MRTEKTYTDMALLLLMGLVPLLWFRDGYNALAGFDFAVYLNPVETLKKSYYIWSDMMAGGYDISHEISSVPYYLLFSLPVLFGASLYTAEKVVFVVIFTLLGLSVYYMLGVLFEKTGSKRAIALTGAVVYTFSYPVMAHFGRGNMMALLTYGLLPLLLGLLYRGFTKPEKEWKYIMLVALLSFPISATKGHPADFVVLMGVALYFVVFNALTSSRRGRIIAFSAKAFVCTLLVNLWWVIPNIIYLRDFGLSTNDLVKEGFYNLDILSYYSRGTSIFNVLRNERLDLWFDVPEDLIFNPGLYQNDAFVLIGLMLPVVALVAACIARRNKIIFFFSSLSLIAVFMGKGNHEPFGWVFEWLYIHVPGFFFFRAPYRIFSSLTTFALTPLVAFTVGSIAGNLVKGAPQGIGTWFKRGFESPVTLLSLKKAATTLFVLSFVFTSALYAWPVFTGAHLRKKGTLREPGVFHRIPEEYSKADEWLKAEKGYFKIYYPYEVYDANTTWGYNGPDPSFELLSVPKVVSRPGGTVYVRYQRPIEALNRVLWDFRYGDLKKVLSFYNVRYALLHEDFSRWVMPDYNFNKYADSLFKANAMELRKKIGPLAFYENDEYLPRVYGARKGYLLAGDEEAFPALSLTGYLTSPFIVMAKDIGVAEIKKTLETLDGAVFYNSNTVDLACALLEKSYGRGASGGSLNFRTDGKGPYEVYVKDPAGEAFLEGHEPDETVRGFSWRKIAETELEKGPGVLKLKNASPRVRALVIPRGLFGEIKALVDKRLESGGFEVAYIFNRDAQQNVSVSLAGSKDYHLSVNVPVQYTKKKAYAFEKNSWRYESGEGDASSNATGETIEHNGPKAAGGRIIVDFDGIDIGEYPKLVFDASDFSKKRIKLGMELELDGRRDLEKKTEVEETIPENGEIDLSEVAKKKYSAAVYRLKRIEIRLEGSEKNLHGGAEFAGKPVLAGEFGVRKMRCQGRGGIFKLGDSSFTVKAAKCGAWDKDTVFVPGEYIVKNTPGGELDYLVFIRKSGGAEESRRAPAAVFEMINPTRYIVRPVLETTKIVFSDSYNSGWSAYVNGKRFSPVKVNGYANGFIIPRSEGDITMEYSPQRVFDYSKIASLTAIAAVVITVGIKARKSEK